MKREIYLNEEFAAVAEDGRLAEYIPVNPEERTGAVLWGKVGRIMKGTGSAFIDIGRKKAGFIPISENSKSFTGEPIRSGEYVRVQIRKEENGGKGAYLSRDITIPGEYVIVMPENRYTGISSRISDPDDRDRLSCIGKTISGDRYGIVMRHSALGKKTEVLREEAERLIKQWSVLKEKNSVPATGKTIYSGNSIEDELKNDYAAAGITSISYVERLPDQLKMQLEDAYLRKIRLPHGGNIVIDRCEAMTVIDVNSGSDSGRNSVRETIREINREACREIVRQIRLRNISGIIIIDLIDCEKEDDRLSLPDILREELRADRIKTVVHGITDLGLIEMTRKRSRPAFAEIMTEKCDKCGGSGVIRRKVTE